MKNGKNKLVIGLIILAVVLILGGGGFYFYNNMTSSKNIFRKTISEAIHEIKSEIKKVDSSKVDFSLKIKADLGSEYTDITNIINKLDINGSIAVNSKSNKMLVDFNSNYDGKTLVNADLYYANSKAYLYLDGVYDKYISLPVDEIDVDNKIDQDNLDQVLTSVENAINSSFKDEYFTQEKEDGSYKTTLKITNEVSKKLSYDVVNKLKKDEKFLKSCATLAEMTKEEVLNELDEIINSTDLDNEPSDSFISIYTKGIRQEVEKLVIESSHSKLVLTINNDTYKIEMFEKGELIGTLTIVEKNDNYDISIKSDSININLNLKESNNYKFKDKDVSNSVEVDNLSDEEYGKIMDKISQNEGFVEIITILTLLSM